MVGPPGGCQCGCKGVKGMVTAFDEITINSKSIGQD